MSDELFPDENVLEATNRAINGATHLGPQDAGAVAAIRALARKIDGMDEYYHELRESYRERDLRPPSPDNVSLPTYLRYAESLGLTPAGRAGKPTRRVGPPSAAARAAEEKPDDTGTDGEVKPTSGLTALRGGVRRAVGR